VGVVAPRRPWQPRRARREEFNHGGTESTEKKFNHGDAETQRRGSPAFVARRARSSGIGSSSQTSDDAGSPGWKKTIEGSTVSVVEHLGLADALSAVRRSALCGSRRSALCGWIEADALSR
jgi:hypothetical protein